MRIRPVLLLPAVILAACGVAGKSAAPMPPSAASPPWPLVYPATFAHPDPAKVPEASRKLIVFVSDDGQRRLLLNGIAWSAGIEVPAAGVPDTRPDDAELLENQDSPPAPGWEPMPGQPGRDHPAAPKPSA